MLPTNDSQKPVIVVSGINMVEGGILTILRECLTFLDKKLTHDYQVIALVHDKKLFNTRRIQYIEFKSKSTWVKRIYHEYFYFGKISRKLKPHLWFSLHDVSPSVQSRIKAVYCHNATPFYSPSFDTLFLEPKLVAFSLLYKYLYKVNIRKNNFVVVQQQWIKREFERMFSIDNVIVSHPVTIAAQAAPAPVLQQPGLQQDTYTEQKIFQFFYPSFPRSFKNFEIVCAAAELLQQQGITGFEVIITIAGSENKYTRKLYSRYKHVPAIRWIGLIPLDKVHDLYNQVDVLIFPSKLETWGLPMSEFQNYEKPILAADLPYAHETASGYSKIEYFNPEDAAGLSRLMLDIMNNKLAFSERHETNRDDEVFAGWESLFKKILT